MHLVSYNPRQKGIKMASPMGFEGMRARQNKTRLRDLPNIAARKQKDADGCVWMRYQPPPRFHGLDQIRKSGGMSSKPKTGDVKFYLTTGQGVELSRFT
jgi:hypothetical protein